MDSAAAAAATKSAGKARPPGIAKQCATTKPELAGCSTGMNSGIAEHGALKELDFAVLEELREQFEREFGYSVEF